MDLVAFSLVQDLQGECRRLSLPGPMARLLLLEGAAHLRLSRCPLRALTPLAQCLATASSSGAVVSLPCAHCLAVALLAEMHFDLGHLSTAAALLTGALPKVSAPRPPWTPLR
jgi:hypothetical protein